MRLAHALALATTATLAALVPTSRADAQSVSVGSAVASFQQARAAYDAGRYADALALFQGSYAAESSPNTLLYIGRCQRQLGRLRDAYITIARAAADANQRAIAEPRFTPTAEAARTEAQALVPQLAFVTVHVDDPPPGTEVRLHDEPLESGSWDQRLPFEPGGLDVRARAPDHEPFQRQVRLDAGQQVRIEIALVRTAGSPAPAIFVPGTALGASSAAPSGSANVLGPAIIGRPRMYVTERRTPAGRIAGFVGMAAGGAVSVFAIVASVFAESEYQQLVALCGEGRCLATVPNVGAHQSAGRAWEVSANVSWIAGSVLFAAGSIMAIAIRPVREEIEVLGPVRHVRIAFDPMGGASISGVF